MFANIPAGQHGSPLVVRTAGEHGRRQASAGHHLRELRIVAEDVQLPRGAWDSSNGVLLKPYAMHGVTDGGLNAGQVGVGLVVRAAHQFQAAVPEQSPDEYTILRVGVPVRLEVVDFGKDEAVVRILAGLRQVCLHQAERAMAGPGETGCTVVGDPRLIPRLRVAGLGIPPDRVVVEVRDEPDGPEFTGGLRSATHAALPSKPGGKFALRSAPRLMPPYLPRVRATRGGR